MKKGEKLALCLLVDVKRNPLYIFCRSIYPRDVVIMNVMLFGKGDALQQFVTFFLTRATLSTLNRTNLMTILQNMVSFILMMKDV